MIPRSDITIKVPDYVTHTRLSSDISGIITKYSGKLSISKSSRYGSVFQHINEYEMPGGVVKTLTRDNNRVEAEIAGSGHLECSALVRLNGFDTASRTYRDLYREIANLPERYKRTAP